MSKNGFKVVAQSQVVVEEVPATPPNHMARIQADIDRAIPLNYQKAEEEFEKFSSKHKLIFLIVPVFLFFVVFAWALCGTLFTRYKIGNSSVSMIATKQTLKQVISAQTQAYKITVNYPDKTNKSYSLQDAGLQTDVEATVSSVRHFRLENFLTWWQPKPIDLVYKVDQKAFNNFIAKSLTVIIQPAEDARLTINNGNIAVTNSTTGKRYGLPDPQESIENVAATLQTNSINLGLLALRPSITTVQLASSKTKLKKVLTQKIEFTIAGNVISPTSSDIGNWVELTSNEKNKDVAITVNSGKILSYINKMAAWYIHPPRDEVVMTHKNGTKTVLVQGMNGIDIVTKSSIATDLAKNLLAAKGTQINLPVQSASYKTITVGEYDRWLEVNLTTKRMYAYEKNKLVRTFLVSAGAPATPTVIGQFHIYSKLVQHDMRGQNVDGTNYFQPHVPWVNYFYKDYAIHGNYWRPLSWFGNINSSHGCVGITPSDGEWIYNWAPIGTTVITHT